MIKTPQQLWIARRDAANTAGLAATIRRALAGPQSSPFYAIGQQAFRDGVPFARNESDPWRAGWLAAAGATRALG